MRKYKHYHIIVLVGGILLFSETTYAQWPVFDFTEIIPIGKDVKSGIDTVKELKNQLEMKKNTLNSIGKEINSFATFSKGIKKSKKSGEKAADNAVSTSQNGENTTKEATTNTSNDTTSTVNTQKEMVEDYVDQTRNVLEEEKPDTSLPFKVSENMIAQNIIFEEEEEEEEVDGNAVEEEIKALQSASLAEHKQLAVELNDVLDTQLTLLNKSATDNMSALAELDSAIQQIKKISPDNKKRLQEEISQISQKQRENSDWGIRIVENVKENYNKEYNNVIKDGINNYTKVVIAYIRGDANWEDVVKAGEKLKRDVNLINVTPDAGVLNELYQATANVRKDIENLATEVNKILNDTQKT